MAEQVVVVCSGCAKQAEAVSQLGYQDANAAWLKQYYGLQGQSSTEWGNAPEVGQRALGQDCKAVTEVGQRALGQDCKAVTWWKA